MGYRLNRLDEPVFMAEPKPMRSKFGIHQRLESCAGLYPRDDSTSTVDDTNADKCITMDLASHSKENQQQGYCGVQEH